MARYKITVELELDHDPNRTDGLFPNLGPILVAEDDSKALAVVGTLWGGLMQVCEEQGVTIEHMLALAQLKTGLEVREWITKVEEVPSEHYT